MNPDTASLFKTLAEMTGLAPTDQNAEQLAREISLDCRRRKLATAIEALALQGERRRYLDQVGEALAHEQQRRRHPG